MTASVAMTRWALLGFLLVLLSCSSHDGGGTGGTGIDSQPVFVRGTVTEVGSVVVGGIRFDTSAATIVVNDQPGSEVDLRVGHVVIIDGTLDASGTLGTAETVRVDNNLVGPIDRIGPATNSLVVLGQLVIVDDMTQFGDTPFSALRVGNIVALSGFEDTQGVLRATRVDKMQDVFSPGLELEVNGTITSLDEAMQTFTLESILNRLQVDFSAAQRLPADTPLRDGQTVEVKSSRNVENGTLVADRVEVKDVGLRGEPGTKGVLEGIITRIIAADTFEVKLEVGVQIVRHTQTTTFEGGTVSDIAADQRVEVEGVFDADRILVAQEIDFAVNGTVEIEGIVTTILSTDTFDVNGQVVRLTPDTAYTRGSIDDIVINAQLQVEGFFDAHGVLVATGIEFFVDTEGIITAMTSADIFEVEGQGVRLTSDTVFENGTANDLAIGRRVEVEGLFDDHGVLVAISVEFL
jgi:hypothetical protein